LAVSQINLLTKRRTRRQARYNAQKQFIPHLHTQHLSVL
jgi:hypothetical protein